MEPLDDSFDIISLINEVKKRPAIWNANCDEYSNKVEKKKGWNELARIFGDSDNSEEKNKILLITLQKKWRNVRDNFMRELKKVQNSLPGASKKHPFYFSRLLFLQPNNNPFETENNSETNDDDNDKPETVINSEVIVNENSNSCNEVKSNTSKQSIIHPTDKYFTDILEKCCTQGKCAQDRDEDELFSLSLSKEIKKFPESVRLELKIEILNLILKKKTPQFNPIIVNSSSSANYVLQPNVPNRSEYSHANQRNCEDINSKSSDEELRMSFSAELEKFETDDVPLPKFEPEEYVLHEISEEFEGKIANRNYKSKEVNIEKFHIAPHSKKRKCNYEDPSYLTPTPSTKSQTDPNMKIDEFFYFSKNIGDQLRQMPEMNAMMCQIKIQNVISHEQVKIATQSSDVR